MLARRALLVGSVVAALAAVMPQADADADVYVRIGPPAPRYERIPPAPVGPHRWVWTPGYWRWYGGRYAWVGGRYVRRDHGYWRAGHWDHRARGWVWIGGGWY